MDLFLSIIYQKKSQNMKKGKNLMQGNFHNKNRIIALDYENKKI
jgi:hypothetical protein